jgi:uncharacterized glyoxalase superfamily protein PhnB
MQRIIPYLLYADAPAALEFLCKAFGFEEQMRMPGPEGRIMHAQLAYQGNTLMLATTVKEMGHASPRDLPARHGLIVCYVDDVDAHCARAKAAGAKILADPEDQFYGDRVYRAADTEGHEWSFHTHVRDVAPEDLKPPA